MADASSKTVPVEFPGVFRPAAIYLVFLGVLTLTGLAVTLVSFRTHNAQSTGVVSALTGVMLGLLVVVLSTSVKVDDDGIVERSVLGKTVTAWDGVGVIDKMSGKGVALKSTAGRNLVLITLLTGPVQDAIVEEAIRRGKMRKVTDDKQVKQNRKQGIIEQWKK